MNHIFSYFLYDIKKPFSKIDPLWKVILPNSRKDAIKNFEKDFISSGITYGNYFVSVSSFLQYYDFKFLKKAISHKVGRLIDSSEIKHVSIRLEKHGAFYHPSKIEVFIKKQTLIFVVNVALSKRGRQCMDREIVALNLLNKTTPFDFLPKIYSYYLNKFFSNVQLSMFIGEWFENFYEFHLSMNFRNAKNEVVVWNSMLKNKTLSGISIMKVYNQIAMILASYYDPVTSKHISSWHNASGDFVAKLDENSVNVRLITVRNFSPMIPSSNISNILPKNEIMHAITIFFLNTSIRVRLDRLDGVNNLVLLDGKYVNSIIRGFFRGLSLQARNKIISDNFINFFRTYMLSYSEEELFNLSFEIINKIYKKQKDESLIIFSKLAQHIKYLYLSMKELNLTD